MAAMPIGVSPAADPGLSDSVPAPEPTSPRPPSRRRRPSQPPRLLQSGQLHVTAVVWTPLIAACEYVQGAIAEVHISFVSLVFIGVGDFDDVQRLIKVCHLAASRVRIG